MLSSNELSHLCVRQANCHPQEDLAKEDIFLCQGSQSHTG